jgi:surfeit locus 1 family protein
VLRTALTPRFLGLLALVLVVCAAFVWLGRWQLGVAESTAHREAVEHARSQAPAELTTLVAPHAPFRSELSSRPFTATGRYAPTGQLLVPDRRLDGRTGSWLLTPFVVDGSGATLPVVRGFVPDAAAVPPAPTGPVTIRGGLAPGESPSTEPVPSGELGSVDLAQLVNLWPGELYNAFGFVEAEDPPSSGQPVRVPTPVGESGVRWRNAAYAVQWWLFALFALWMWGRMVRDESRRSRGAEPEAEAEPGPGGKADAQGDVASGGGAPALLAPVRSGENARRDHP